MINVLKRCFEINLNDYENIGVNLEINKVIAGAFAVLILGVFILNSYRANVRLAVMQLTRHGATSPENAKTLKELGLDNSKGVKRLLGKNNILTKIVARVGEKQYSYEEYKALSKKEKKKAEEFDINAAAFYIREDKIERAAHVIDRYITSKLRNIAILIFLSLLCVCIIACMPGILNLLDNLIYDLKM